MASKLNATSLNRLEGVHPHLVKVVKRAAEITEQPFQVSEGVRSLSRQRELVRKGASKTLKSRHLKAPNGLGHAVDLVAMVGGRVSWEVPLYHRIADAMKRAAREMGVPLDWGGDWAGFFDGPHYQLPWGDYPGVASADLAPLPSPTARELSALAAGATGDRVRALQETLVALGAKLTSDGDFGPKTRAALLAVTSSVLGKRLDVVTAPQIEALEKAARKAAKRAA